MAKTSLEMRLREATQEAARTLEEHNITRLPVDPFAIAGALDIGVEPLPSAGTGISGALIKVGDNFKIAYATHIASEGFVNFSVAHELGHYHLPGHPDHLLVSGMHQSRAGFGSGDPYELQADHYAADLLLPPSLTAPIIDATRPGIETVEALREACVASTTASAIHYAKQSPDAVAVVVSEGQDVAYCFVSETLREYIGWSWARKGSPVPERSGTHTFNGDPSNVAKGKRRAGTCMLSQWFDEAPDHEMSEDVIGLGAYGKTLTVLFSDEAMPEADEDEDF